jgi:hypothetical protein
MACVGSGKDNFRATQLLRSPSCCAFDPEMSHLIFSTSIVSVPYAKLPWRITESS